MDSITDLDIQIKEKTYLGKDGLFVTEEEYPKFVRQEIIVNAVTHRTYSISGTDIQIKMFDDGIVGKLMFQLINIRCIGIAQFNYVYNCQKKNFIAEVEKLWYLKRGCVSFQLEPKRRICTANGKL